MSTPPRSAVRYRLNEAVVARAIGDEMLLLDLNSGVYHSLNEVATVVYRRLQDGASQQELVDAVVEAFAVDEERAAADVQTFLDDEIVSGLVTIA